ncbi:MAG: hypothetical protein J6Q02_02560 [Lachnospiraceae bacterium]|nr:hypothetical protein [Lachnospiraceae bacterium]
MTKKERIQRYGEVFTPDWMVRKMCDLLELESPDCFMPDKTFLEPTCGEGAFVIEILRRKFERCEKREDFEAAIRSVYAFEIQADNVEKTIRNVTEFCQDRIRLTKREAELIRDHVIQCDGMKVMRMISELEARPDERREG